MPQDSIELDSIHSAISIEEIPIVGHQVGRHNDLYISPIGVIPGNILEAFLVSGDLF
jgi:hypothetical protein